tara:strand:- start:269 stop:841 length:573 start_codon:yes stop_codon:yes gene_type:complete
MKKLLLLFIPLVFFFSCEEEENSDTNNNMGYDCTTDGCYAAENAQYISLSDCESACDNNNGCILLGTWNSELMIQYSYTNPGQYEDAIIISQEDYGEYGGNVDRIEFRDDGSVYITLYDNESTDFFGNWTEDCSNSTITFENVGVDCSNSYCWGNIEIISSNNIILRAYEEELKGPDYDCYIYEFYLIKE